MPRDSSLMINIRSSIIERYGYISLRIDVLHINKRPYIIAISKHIKFIQCMGTENKNTTTFLATIKKFKSDYMIRGFVLKTIYADGVFESCKSELSEQGIILLCCDTSSHVPFIKQAIKFVNERVRCVRSMLPKRIKRILARLMRELVVSTVMMVNSIRRKGGVHPVMSPRLIVTAMKIVLPPYPPGLYVYGDKGGTTNIIDNSRTIPALYLRPNTEGGGHFVYNIHTMQRCSVCQVIGINKKPIPMGDDLIKLINKQA